MFRTTSKSPTAVDVSNTYMHNMQIGYKQKIVNMTRPAAFAQSWFEVTWIHEKVTISKTNDWNNIPGHRCFYLTHPKPFLCVCWRKVSLCSHWTFRIIDDTWHKTLAIKLDGSHGNAPYFYYVGINELKTCIYRPWSQILCKVCKLFQQVLEKKNLKNERSERIKWN